jgi:hypothetical protein
LRRVKRSGILEPMQGHVAYQVNPAFFRLYPPEFPAGSSAFPECGGFVIFIFFPRENPVKYTDPDGKASILSRLINKGVTAEYDIANEAGKSGISIFRHSLVDMGDLNSVSDVYQYSGKTSGFTRSDAYSKEKSYAIVYNNLDEELTEQAVKNVLSLDRFGANDNRKAGELYKIFSNDCNTFTREVFTEYRKLWKEREKPNHSGLFGFFSLELAWRRHYSDIKKDSGKAVDINE